VGLYILLAWLLLSLFYKQQYLRVAVPVFALVAIFSVLLFLRVQVWSDALRLSAFNVRNHPESSRSRYFLADAYLQQYSRALKSSEEGVRRGDYLLVSRHHFERMYQLNPRDFAALVMLYYLDSEFFPELQQYNDWFAKLQEVAANRPLQASDRSSLNALLNCFSNEICTASEEDLFTLLETLEARYPQSIDFLMLRYRYLEAIGAPVERRLAILARAQSMQPANIMVYQYQLSEFAAMDDMSALYEAIRLWMLHDAGRQNLGVIHTLFTSADIGGSSREGDGGR
jgi:hypothetical protein